MLSVQTNISPVVVLRCKPPALEGLSVIVGSDEVFVILPPIPVNAEPSKAPKAPVILLASTPVATLASITALSTIISDVTLPANGEPICSAPPV